MEWTKRARIISSRVFRPIVEGFRKANNMMRARDEAEITSLVTMLHSPEYYNPTTEKIALLQRASRRNISATAEQIILDAGVRRSEKDHQVMRERGTEVLLSKISDPERRRILHIRALELALAEWRKQSIGQEITVDQGTYLSNSNRILDRINRLGKQSSTNPSTIG